MLNRAFHKYTLNLQDVTTSSDSSAIKLAPSWTNVAQKTESTSTSSSGPSTKSPTEDEIKGSQIEMITTQLHIETYYMLTL